MLPGHDQSAARGVSPQGRWIVGRSVLSAEHVEAFAWSQGTGTFALGDLPGGQFRSIAHAVSRNGRVIIGSGSVEVNGKHYGEPFRWTPENGMQGMGVLRENDPGGSAQDVTPDGNIIVGGSSSEAFRWTESEGMVGLGVLDESVFSSGALAISSNGNWIVGISRTRNIDGGVSTQAVYWDESNNIHGLGWFDGVETGLRYSFASDVSDDGRVIVGTGYAADSQWNVPHAFIWTPEWGMRPVMDILLDYGIDVEAEGWVKLTSATGISADGRTITGIGAVQGLGTQGWVVTLPIPAPSTLAPLAAFGLLATRRRRHYHPPCES